MLYTPAYIFTLLLAVWVLSLIGCVVFGIACYRLLDERRRLRAQLDQVAKRQPFIQSNALQASARSANATPFHSPHDADRDREPEPSTGE
jgi:hypothetical protein